MKNLLIILMAFLLPFSIMAQIEGKVVDESGEAIAFANVTLWADSTFVAGEVTQSDGGFCFENSLTGVNRLRVSLMGYEDFEKTITSSGSDIGIITLMPKTTSLKEVAVSAHVPSYKLVAGGVKSSIKGSTMGLLGNAMDVIAQQPGVRADDGKIEVFGKGIPEIYVNGRKLNNYSELYQLSSQEIDNIEVLNNPGAKYGAEIQSVILIKTIRKQGDGLSGSVSAGLRLGHYWQQNDNASLNYRVGNVDIFSSFAFDHARRFQEQRNNTLIMCGGNKYYINSDITIRPRSTSYNAVGGINWRINPNHTLGARYEYQGVPSNPSLWQTKETETINGHQVSLVDYRTYWKRSNTPVNIVNAYYNGTIRNVSLTINNDFYHSSNRSLQNVFQTEENANHQITGASSVRSSLFASKGIAEYSFGENLLEGGYDFTYTDRHDRYSNQGIDLKSTDDRIKEHTLAGFVGLTLPIKKCEIYGSVRYEHTMSDYYQLGRHVAEQSRKYDRILPYVDFTFPVSKAKFTLSYSAKTKRPRYSQLSSSIQYDDRFTYETGNPLLKPELINDLGLAGIWKWVYFSADYQYVHDAMVGVVEAYQADEPINLMTYKNYGHVSKYSIVLSLSPRIKRWTPRLRLNLLGQDFSIPSINGEKELNNPLLFINSYNSFFCGKGFTATADVLCRTYGEMDVVTMKPSWQINLGLIKTYKNWYFQLNATDIFKTARNSMITYGSQMRLDKWNYSDTQGVRMTIRYSFNPTTSRYKGKGAGNEEKSRL